MAPRVLAHGGCRTRLLPVLLAAVASMALPGAAAADADGPDYFRVQGVAPGDMLAIRADADAAAEQPGAVPAGADGLRNLGCVGGPGLAEWQAASAAERAEAERNRWCRIALGGAEGWVPARHLAEGTAPTATAAVSMWRVTDMNGAPPEGAPEIGFYADGGFAGGTGCNRFSARGRAEDGRLIVEGPVATTRMACPEPLQTQEARILAMLEAPVALRFDPFADALELIGERTKLALLRTAPDETEAPVFLPDRSGAATYWGLSGVRSDLHLRAAPAIEAEVLARLLPGAMLRGFACVEAEGRRWCDVETVEGETLRGWAAADYLVPADSARRSGYGVFDATGPLPCARRAGQPMGSCTFGVARDGGGTATVMVAHPDGPRRALFFVEGELLGADTSQADGYPEVSAIRESGLTFVRVGPERYEIIDAVLFGG